MGCIVSRTSKAGKECRGGGGMVVVSGQARRESCRRRRGGRAPRATLFNRRIIILRHVSAPLEPYVYMRFADFFPLHLAVQRTAFAASAQEGTRPSSLQLWGKSPEMQNVSRARTGKRPPPSTAAGRGTAGRSCPLAGLASKAILQRVGPAGNCSAKIRVLWYAQDCAGALLLLIDTVMRTRCPSGRREHNGAYSWAARSCVFFPSRTLARSCFGGVGWLGCGTGEGVVDQVCTFFLSFLFMMQFSFEFLQGVYLSLREGGRAPELDNPDLSFATYLFRRLLLTMFIF